MERVTSVLEELETSLSDRTRRISPDSALAMISSISEDLPDFSLFVVQIKFFRDSAEESPETNLLLMNYLSFQIRTGQLLRFRDRESCAQAFSLQQGFFEEVTPNVVVTHDETPEEDVRLIIHRVARVMSALFQFHVYEGILEAASKRFSKNLRMDSDTYTNFDLLRTLSQNYPVPGLSLLSCQFEDDEGLPTILEVDNFGRHNFEVFNLIAPSLRQSVKQGRPLDGYAATPDGRRLYYTILSTSTQNFKAINGDGTSRFVVVFDWENPIDDFLIRFIREGLTRSAEADKPKQLEILKALDASKRELHRAIRSGEIRTDRDRQAFVRSTCKGLCKSIYSATLAHSVTIRLFDPFDRSLVLFSECSFSSGRYKVPTDVDIPADRTQSVNVRTFRTSGPNEYIYLPVLRKGSGAIAEPYNPRSSSSEACFPIWQLGVPIGTMNLESPQVHAFAQDILFLQSVARLLGDLFQAASDTVAPDAIAQISTSNEIVHGVASTEEDADFAAHDVPVTMRKQIEAYQKFMVAYRSPVPEFVETGETASIRTVVREAIEAEMIDFRLRRLDWNRALPPTDMTVGGYEAAGVRAVVQSIVANAEKHSSLADDEFRVFLLTRGGTKLFVLRYCSRHRLAPIEVVSEFGLRPFDLEGRISYGAFLLASRVRSMDGVMHVRRHEDQGLPYVPLEIVIAIPVG